ncbi:MAG: 23S rRNA pseudouridylate synthase B, partial [Diaphorobacter nitroreducens]
MNDESHKDPDSMGGRSPSPASEAAAPRRPRKRKSAEGALQEDAAVPQLSADGAQSDVKMQEVHEQGAAVEVPRQSSGHAAKRAPKGDGYQFADVVSGQFDEDEANAELAPAKRVLLPQPETPKLHKVLAQAGMGSRLELEQLILEGR